MKILLSGGAGYIGSQVSNLLIDAGHKVTIIDRWGEEQTKRFTNELV